MGNTLISDNLKFQKVTDAQNSLYSICDFDNVVQTAEIESKEYFAHHYIVADKHIRYRIAKKTPTKTGQFVTIWKRLPNGNIGPYDAEDKIDLFIVNIIDGNKIGQFIFPKSVLIKNNILSVNGKGGKRAMRIYSTWDSATNTQAIRTKKWQTQYFFDITPGNFIDIEKIKSLYLS